MNLTLDVNNEEEVVSVIEGLADLINDLLMFISEIERELDDGSPDEVRRIIQQLYVQLEQQEFHSEKLH